MNKIKYYFSRIAIKIFHPTIPAFKNISPELKNLDALEIGGPTIHFSSKGFFPIYPLLQSRDNVNYGNETIWEGKLLDMSDFVHNGKKIGTQYIREAVDLHGIATGSYDVVLSSHVIEHTSNPIRAINEWMRVLRIQGYLILIVPWYIGTFDRLRTVTSFEHLLEDFRNGTTEDDLTHAGEFIDHFDYSMHPNESPDDLKKDIFNNIEKRRLHHHVFDVDLAAAMVKYCRAEIAAVTTRLPSHIVVIAKKSRG